MKKITGMEWLENQITKIEVTSSTFQKEINIINGIEPEVYNEFQAWTPLKLILLNYSLNVCTTIIRKIIKETSYIFNAMYYIDLFAGSGINKIKGSENDFLIGSPFISTLNYVDDYTSLFFCEKDEKYFNALTLRLNTLNKKNIKVLLGNYQDHFTTIINEVKGRRKYSFFFIDPFAMEFDWKDMKEVLEVRSDIIFTLMTGQIYREVCAGKKRGGKSKLTNFFGDDSWKDIDSQDKLVEVYKKNILNARPEAPIITIEIQSRKHGFCYHLLFITNKTSHDNQWLRAIEKARSEIEKNSDIAVEKAMDIIKKRQCKLLDFSNK